MAEMDLGHFGDERLKKMAPGCCGALRIDQTVCLRKLGDDPGRKVKFRRFLMNERVTVAKMVASQRARLWRRRRRAGMCWRSRIAAKSTTRANASASTGFEARWATAAMLACSMHPVLAVDLPGRRALALGLLDVQVWRRFKRTRQRTTCKQPIEEKESYRWLKGPHRAKAALAKASHDDGDRRPRG